MKLAKYIYELLLENETVVFPGFGAFISNYKSAEIKENEIIPPSKVISFTRQFRNDDGLLITFIARKAKISQMYAQKRIDRERENMLYLLDKGENVTIENIGILFANEKNEIQFTPFQDENILLDTFGFEPVTIEDTVEKTLVTEEALTETAETETVEAVTETMEPTVEIEKEIESVSTEEPVEQIILPRSLPDWAIEKPEENKKTNWYWYLLILIPVIIAGYFIFRNNPASNNSENYQNQSVINEQHGGQVQSVPAADSIQPDSIQKQVVDSIKIIELQARLSGEDSKYYLVGGGFKSEENAEKYILRLKEKGIEGTMIGKRGNMFLVGIASFNTEVEAYNELNRRKRENPNWKLWVYKN